MATSIKATIRKKPNKEGQYPIVIRVTKDRKSTYLYTGHYIDLKNWDETNCKVRKSHPNSSRLNNLISSKLAEASGTLVNLQSEKKTISSKQIIKEIRSPIEKTTFKELSDSYLDELKSKGRINQYVADRARVRHVLKFSNEAITFKEIDEDFLRKFMSYLKVSKDLSKRSIINNLIVIRTLFNRAIRAGIIHSKAYPFGSKKIRIKFPESEKIGLTIPEIKNIEKLENLTKQEIHARNVWLFSFNLAGMRVGDILKIRWSDIYDGRLHYRMNKNEKLLSLKLPSKVIEILSLYQADKKSDDDFVFPEMKKADLGSNLDVYNKTKTATKKFNKYLESIAEKAKIKKKLTMHIARHSFGNISGDKIPIRKLQKLYRHSSVTTTINYQSNFIHEDTDDALEKVINF